MRSWELISPSFDDATSSSTSHVSFLPHMDLSKIDKQTPFRHDDQRYHTTFLSSSDIAFGGTGSSSAWAFPRYHHNLISSSSSGSDLFVLNGKLSSDRYQERASDSIDQWSFDQHHWVHLHNSTEVFSHHLNSHPHPRFGSDSVEVNSNVFDVGGFDNLPNGSISSSTVRIWSISPPPRNQLNFILEVKP